MLVWCIFEMHPIACAFFLALASAGNNIAARIAMMAMTTSSSISVNAFLPTEFWRRRFVFIFIVI